MDSCDEVKAGYGNLFTAGTQAVCKSKKQTKKAGKREENGISNKKINPKIGGGRYQSIENKYAYPSVISCMGLKKAVCLLGNGLGYKQAVVHLLLKGGKLFHQINNTLCCWLLNMFDFITGIELHLGPVN